MVVFAIIFVIKSVMHDCSLNNSLYVRSVCVLNFFTSVRASSLAFVVVL